MYCFLHTVYWLVAVGGAFSLWGAFDWTKIAVVQDEMLKSVC